MIDSHENRDLGPAELKIAVDAFDAALARTGEFVDDRHPRLVRAAVAAGVLQAMFAGERDVARLSDAGCDSVQRLESRSGTSSKQSGEVPRVYQTRTTRQGSKH